MKTDDTSKVEREVARIDGFLSGLALMNGGLRDYSSCCYVVHVDDGRSVDEVIRNYYHWLPQLRFSSVKRLDGGVRDIEDSLGRYLVREGATKSQGDLHDLRHYLSFKVMDMMSVVLTELGAFEVFELLAESDPHSPQVIFYCISAGQTAVVLQFNDERRERTSAAS
ncbi:MULTISPECIES: hypothetical protein [unclassified Lysobacter]|uniref:hypothetical protein n=1 Tax=unclassified Lysobacter TaxID=2635362 RepID=UPI0012F75B8E|nr:MULTISPECIES: hypothetical protein [unclassified Lysobacter]